MNAQELMRGNYVLIDGVEEQVYSNLLDYDEGADYINDRHIKLVEPIPITEDWMLKFGFEKTAIDEYKFMGIYFNSTSGFIEGTFEIFNLSNPVKFVHHLQNLMHALTGKQLIKD